MRWTAAGHLCLKIAERRAAMIGTDAPRTVDAVQLTQATAPQLTSTERIRLVLDQLMDRTYRTIKGDGDG